MRNGLLYCGIAVAALAVADMPAHAQEAGEDQPERPAIIISDEAPPGFEDVDSSIETLFDVRFAGRTIGSTPILLDDGRVTFLDVEGFAALLPDRVDRAAVTAFFSQPVSSNETLRCLPGRTADCGTLPTGESGVIVTPETFALEVFLSQRFFTALDDAPVYLGPPISGPSLLQTALLSLSTDRGDLGRVQFGATLDTIASVGRTSLVAQTLLRADGSNLQRLFGQRYWGERRAAAGLLQDEQSLTFRSYRVVGGEFGSFFGTRLADDLGQSTPIEIVLPRRATVEVYRDNVLVHTVQLEAGLQRIPTGNLPSGSYPLRIVARDGGEILLEESRVFTRVSGLPPADKLAFNLRAGVRARESFFGGFGLAGTRNESFLPQLTDELIVSASAGRRIGRASALLGQALFVADAGFAELGFLTTRNRIQGLLAASAGTDGSYSVAVNGSFSLLDVDFDLSARHTRNSDDLRIGQVFDEEFRPYFRSEDILTASANFRVAGGNLSLSGSYSRSPRLDDRYSVGARYNRVLDIGGAGGARLTAFGIKTTDDMRFGLTVSFFRRISPRTTAFFGGGVEYRDSDNRFGQPNGIFPVVEGRISRNDQLGTIDLLTQAGASTDADRHRVFASADLTSNLGLADVVVDWEDRRGAGSSGLAATANAFTGFTFGDRGFRAGVTDPGGTAAVRVSIDKSAIPAALDDGLEDIGSYTVIIGNQAVAEFAPDETSTIVLPPFRNYSIKLQPEQAPPYIVDLNRREAPLYPGNVVDLAFPARVGLTLFGQLVDEQTNPIANARIAAGTDTTMTDDQGYFLVTGPYDGNLEAVTSEGRRCEALGVAQLFEQMQASRHKTYLRLGPIICR
ncbi:TcfC E-set like domain-containing protein [Erythrobacteraceae bacterium WH01K]|nr:TcfC E-set like domain-containing protein [Erythrobacteraceae bacterium WH01K]